MKKPVVYWMVHDYPYEEDIQAGIFYKNFAEAIAKEVTLTVIAPIPKTNFILDKLSKKWHAYSRAPLHEIKNGVSIYRPRYFAHPKEIRYGIPHRFMFNSILRLNLPIPDIIHAFGGFPIAMAAARYAREVKKPLVNTFIGSDLNDLPFASERQKKYLIEYAGVASSNLTVSEALKEKFKLITGKDAERLYLPFSANSVPTISKQAAREQLGLDSHKFIALYVGYIYKAKGINELTDALRTLSKKTDVHGIFCGGETSLVKEVIALPNASYAGQLSIDKVLLYMRAADVLVLPSYMEGIPGVIKEAGMCELPVIASNVGGIPELLGKDRGYLIAPHSSSEIEAAILYVMDHPNEAAERAARLKTFIADNFLMDRISSRQLAVYNTVLSAKKAN